MKRKSLNILLSFLIGCTFGILGAWVDHCDETATYLVNTNTSHTEIYPMWEWVTAPLAFPGLMTAIVKHPQDWLIDEEWDYRWTIMIGNGVAYVFIYCAFLTVRSLVRFVRRRLTLKAQHAR
jgi:hypothetical protein